MAIVNKVTTVYPIEGARITDEQIQEHIAVNNQDGWYLVSVVDQLGWFRLFWSKVTE